MPQAASGPFATAQEPDLPLQLKPSEFERVLQEGFPFLRFPDELEARYQSEKVALRLRMIRVGMLWVVLLSDFMLLFDWLMIPDQLATAVWLRLLVFTPPAVLGLLALKHVGSTAREWIRWCTSTGAVSVTVYLCVASSDPLGGPYMSSLVMVLLANGGLARVHFWLTVRVVLMVLLLYAIGAIMLRNPPVAIMLTLAIALIASSVFTLYGNYWLEHEDRSNWLMVQHEHQLLDELDRANQQLDRISRFDALTELANRRHFDEFLAQVWSRAMQDERSIALLMIDIDHFKAFNDHYGHPAGDACLVQVARALTTHLRVPGDLVARFGGEEFVAVLSDTTLAAALAAAERVRDGVVQLAVPHAASPTSPHVTVSIGVACLTANHTGATSAQLVGYADEALYQAKAAGRNTVCRAGQPG